jgi:hypothetical protein
MQQTAPAAAAADHHQLQALRIRTEALLSRLGAEEDAKLADCLALLSRISATRRKRSAFATDVPPNFNTRMVLTP